MATYFQGGIDLFPEHKEFTPNLQLIMGALQTKQSQYDAGFAQVKGLYNSLLASTPSNDELKVRQQQYIKNVEDQLKNLPYVDLSIDSNVNAANVAFDAFSKDKELLYDVNLTKNAMSEYQKGQSLMMSDDPKKRAMHSAISDEYVLGTIDELKRKKAGDGSIFNVKQRGYVPSVDLGEKFKDFLKTNNYSVVSETPDGHGYILKTSNGQLIEKPLYTLMSGLLTGDERKYFDAWGQVIYDRKLKGFMGQGMNEDGAKEAIASEIWQNRFDKIAQNVPTLEKTVAQKEAEIAEYVKTNFPDGKIPIDNSDISKKYQQMEANKLAYENQLNEYKTEFTRLNDPTTKQTEVAALKRTGANYFGDNELDKSLRSIATGMAGLTQSVEVKEDKTFDNILDYNAAIAAIQGRQDVAEMKINAKNGAITIGVDPTTGELTFSGAGVSGGSGKLTEAEKKLIEANKPTALGLQNLPKNMSSVERYEAMTGEVNKNFFGSTMSFVSSIMGDDMGVSKMSQNGISINGAKLFELMTKKFNSGSRYGMGDEFYGKPIVEYTRNEAPANSTAEEKEAQALINTFKEKYGEEFNKYIASRQSENTPQAGATWSQMLGFLKEKAEQKVSSMELSPDKMVKINSYRDAMNRNQSLLNQIQEDRKGIGSKMIEQMQKDKVKDIDLLTTTDSYRGYKRFKTKKELNDELASASATGPVYAYNVGTGQTMNVSVLTPNQMDAGWTLMADVNDREKALKLRKIIKDYDTTVKTINENMLKTYPTLLQTATGEALAQYGMYSFTENEGVTGEVAEKALPMILSERNLSDLNGSIDKKPERSSIDYREYIGNAKNVDKLYLVAKDLQGITLSKDRGNTTVTYMQFDPTYNSADETNIPKAYNVRFDANAVDKLMKRYKDEKDAKVPGADAKLEALQNISSKGLTIRTDEKIEGSMNEFGVLEKTFQENGYYKTDEWLSPYMNYEIKKNYGGEGYTIKGYFNYTDQSGNKQKKDIDLDVPASASLEYMTNYLNTFIFDQIDKSKKLYDAARQTGVQTNPAAFMTREQFQQKLRNGQ